MRVVLKASLKEVFSLADGRLSTNMDDVKMMLSFIFNTQLQTSDLPEAKEALERVNPEWFHDAKMAIDGIKVNFQTNDYKILMKVLDQHYANIEMDIEKIQ